ncbi:MAG: M48 family metallopeptidase [Gemmataceae bacterium]
MPFLLLFLLALVCLPDYWPAPLAWLGVPQTNAVLYGVLTWLGCALFGVWAARRARQTLARLPISEGRERVLHRHIASRRWQANLLGVYFVAAVYLLGWGWVVQQFCTLQSGLLLPGAEILILAPYFVTLMMQWWFIYPVDRGLHELTADTQPFFSRSGYVVFHLRQRLALLAAPFVVLIVDKGLRRLLPESQASVQVLSMILLVALIFVGLPWILRIVLGLRPLPEGELRERLLDTARRLHFRFSDILLWNTHGGVANAMVAGILPWVRYVLLSDRLIQELKPEEVEAVFGHEIGHVKHRHMSYYLGFLFLSLMVLAALWRMFALHILGESPLASIGLVATSGPVSETELVPLITLAGAYIFIVFGFLSRRCERQADIYGCRAVSCTRNDCPGHEGHVTLSPHGLGLCPTGIRIFIDALEKVARINGISRSRPGWLQSWQHSTIARRVEFLQEVLIDPTKEPRFQRTVFLVKWAMLAFLLTAFWILGATQGWEHLVN